MPSQACLHRHPRAELLRQLLHFCGPQFPLWENRSCPAWERQGGSPSHLPRLPCPSPDFLSIPARSRPWPVPPAPPLGDSSVPCTCPGMVCGYFGSWWLPWVFPNCLDGSKQAMKPDIAGAGGQVGGRPVAAGDTGSVVWGHTCLGLRLQEAQSQTCSLPAAPPNLANVSVPSGTRGSSETLGQACFPLLKKPGVVGQPCDPSSLGG